MMRDVFERFRYRWHLWWRERRDDYIGPPGTHSPDWRDYVHRDSPGFQATIAQSSVKFWTETIVVYFIYIWFAVEVARLFLLFLPAARFVVVFVFTILFCLWSIFWISGTIYSWRLRKHFKPSGEPKSSNQSIQLTADRRDDQPSIHETAFVPKFPPFRQR
jgi:hypothetical protein